MRRLGSENRSARRRKAAFVRRMRARLTARSLPPAFASALAVGTISMSGVALHPESANAGPSGCAISGSTVICTGDQSAGVASGTDFPAQPGVPAIETLNVNNLSATIAPGGADAGVSFENTGNGNVNINVDSGRFGIQANGDGIYGRVAGDGNVSITNVGDIRSTTEEGIDAEVDGNGNITIRSTGNIIDDDESIDATIRGNGSVTITNTGDLTSASGRGVDAIVYGDGTVQITNTGNVSAAEEGVFGSANGTGNVTIKQVGDVQSAIVGVVGAAANGEVDVTVSGNVTAQGQFGIFGASNSSNVTIRNNGAVNAQNGYGVYGLSNTGNVDVTVSGDIASRLDGIYAYSDQGDVTVSSSATIITTLGDGIFANSVNGANISVTNSGEVTGNRTGITIFRPGGNAAARVTNSGRVTGNGGFAVDFTGIGQDILNLNAGSVIQGAIDFGSGNDGMGGANPNDIDTLNVGPGVDAVLTFADNSGTDNAPQSAPENINVSGGSALINGGTTLVTVDRTGFAAQGTYLSDLTEVIFNSIDGGETGILPGEAQGNVSGFGAIGKDQHMRRWASVFGGNHIVAETENLARHSHDFGGLMAGIEWGDAAIDGEVGFLAGYGRSDLSITANGSGTDIDTLFGTVYWKQEFGAYRIHTAFAAGLTDNDTTRNVNGIGARGAYNGAFFAPSLTVSMPLMISDVPVSLGARASYASLYLEGYTETGVAQPLTISDRYVSYFNFRGQMDLPEIRFDNDKTETKVNVSLGADFTRDAGSEDVAANVAGAPIGFDGSLAAEEMAFVSLNVISKSQERPHFFSFNVETQTDFKGGLAIMGELKATYRF